MTRSSGKRWLRTLALFLLLLAAARFTDCSPTLFWARRSHLTDLISAMLPPDWGYAPRILAPLLATVQMSVTGTALGSFLALLLPPLCAENLHAPKPLRWTLRLLVQVLRSFPTLILALLATFLFGLGTFSGTVAITVYTFAILTRLTYEDIESAELAPYHALCAMGGLLFGPGLGFVAAGLGSALYDLTAGYGAECLITFATKGAIALVAGLIALGIAHKPETGRSDVLRVVIACVAGALTYVALYMLKTFIFGMWVNGLGMDGTLAKMGTKLPGSLINALFACVAGPVLFLALKPALRHAGLLEKM